MPPLPVINGKSLIALLQNNGWFIRRFATHGYSLTKYDKDSGKNLVTVIPNTSEDLPPGTLMDILGMKQTRLRKVGLIKLLEKDA